MLPACSKFWEIARAKGSASQDKKQAIIQALVVASRPRTNEACVIIRAMLVSRMCRIASERFSRQAVGSWHPGIIMQAMLVSGRCRIALERLSREAVGSWHPGFIMQAMLVSSISTIALECLSREAVGSWHPGVIMQAMLVSSKLRVRGSLCLSLQRDGSQLPSSPAHWVADPAAPGVTCRRCMQSV